MEEIVTQKIVVASNEGNPGFIKDARIPPRRNSISKVVVMKFKSRFMAKGSVSLNDQVEFSR